jgi:hypothetical protein
LVNRIAGGRVTLAIEAPVSVRIRRGELAPIDAAAEVPVKPEPVAEGTADSTLSTSVTVAAASGAGGTGGISRAVILPAALARRTLLPKMQAAPNPEVTNPRAPR